MTLHDREELDDDLRGRTDEDLTLAPALGIDNVVLDNTSQPLSLHVQRNHIDLYSRGSHSKNTHQLQSFKQIVGYRLTKTETRTILSCREKYRWKPERRKKRLRQTKNKKEQE